MPVLDWFWEFTKRHMERIPCNGWPAPENLYWEDVWLAGMVKHGVVEGVADDASKALAQSDNPPRFLDDQWSGFLASVKTVWSMSESPSDAVNYAAVQAQNKGCEYCYGMGMVSRRFTIGDRPRVGITLYCVCPAGRWLKAEHAKHSDDADKTLKNRIPDLADHPRLKSPEIAGGHVISHARGLTGKALDAVYGSIRARASPAPARKHAWTTGQVEPNHPVQPPRAEPEQQQTGTDYPF